MSDNLRHEPPVPGEEKAVELEGGGRTLVTRRGNTILRPVAPWTATIHALLRHLEAVGFSGSPRVVADGYDGDGNEVLAYIDGESPQPHAWSEQGVWHLGRLLRRLHEATASFSPPDDAVWQPYYFRSSSAEAIIGHGDASPWNILAQDGVPVAFVDWEDAGPIERMDEIAHAAWLNAQLHDDDVADRQGLPGAEERAHQLRAFLDGYELPPQERESFVSHMIEYAIRDCAREAIEAQDTPESRADDALPPWAMAWRARSAAWMIQHRALLDRAISL